MIPSKKSNDADASHTQMAATGRDEDMNKPMKASKMRA
jgi:hypothetical protein